MIIYRVERFPRLGGLCTKLFESRFVLLAIIVWWFKKDCGSDYCTRIREVIVDKPSYDHRIVWRN